LMQAAPGAGIDAHQIKAQVRDMISGPELGNPFLRTVLGLHLST
jgi:hypothetical protein